MIMIPAWITPTRFSKRLLDSSPPLTGLFTWPWSRFFTSLATSASASASASHVSSSLLHTIQEIQTFPELKHPSPLFTKTHTTTSWLTFLLQQCQKDIQSQPKLKILVFGERNVGRWSLLKVLFGVNAIEQWLCTQKERLSPNSTSEWNVHQSGLVFSPEEWNFDALSVDSAPPWASQLKDTVWTLPPSLDHYLKTLFQFETGASSPLHPLLSYSQDAQLSLNAWVAQHDVVVLMTDESRALHGGWESLFLHLLSTRNQSKCMLLINTSSSLSSSSSSGGSSVPSSKVLPWVKISTQLALVAQYLPTCHPDAQKQAGIQAWVSTFLKTSPPPATSQRVVDGLVFILDGIETQLRQDQACTAQLSQWCTTFTQRVHHDMQEELSRFQTSCVTSKTSFELFEEGKVAMAIHGILKNALLACQHEHRSSVHPMEFNSLFERFQTLLELATSHPLIEQPLWMTVPRPPVTQAFMQEIYWQGFGVQLFTWSTFVAGAFMELYPLYPGGLYMLNVSLGLAGWTWLKSKIVRRRILRSWEKQLIQARKENMDKHRARLLKFVQTPLQEINEILSFNMNEREKRHMERLNHVQRLKNEIEKIKIH